MHFVAAILTETTTGAAANNKKNFYIPSRRDKFCAMSLMFFHRVVQRKERNFFTLYRICERKIFQTALRHRDQSNINIRCFLYFAQCR